MRRYPPILRFVVLAMALSLPLWEVHCAWAMPLPGHASADGGCDHSSAPGTNACCVGCVQFSAAQVPSSVSVDPPGKNPAATVAIPPQPLRIAADFHIVGRASSPASESPPGPAHSPSSPRSPPLPA